MTTTKDKRKREETKDGEYLITYTRHLEKRLRNLEAEKQLLDAERLRLKQETVSSSNGVEKKREERERESPILRLMQLLPANFRNLFGEILEKLMQIMLSTRNLGEQSLREVKSSFSKLLEEIEALRKTIQEPSKILLKWYELHSVKADHPPVSDPVFKIIVLGKPEKTAFIRMFTTGIFAEDLKMTLGADFSTKNVEIEGIKVSLRIWDFATEERFKDLLPPFIKGSNGAIIMYDVIDTKTLKDMSEVIELVKKSVGNIPIFLNIPELPSKAEEFADFLKKYTLTEIPSDIGLTGENIFRLLAKKMLEHKEIE